MYFFVRPSAILIRPGALIVKSHPPRIGALIFVLTVGLSVVSCGRRGPLEPPPGALVSSAPLNGRQGDYEAAGTPGEFSGQTAHAAAPPSSGKPAAPPAPARPFFLDPLL